MNTKWLSLIGTSVALAAITLTTQGASPETSAPSPAAKKSHPMPGPTPRPKKPRAGHIQTIDANIPITVKAAASPSGFRMFQSRPKAHAQSIPTSSDRVFEFTPDTWPTGVTQFTAKVRCFEATISEVGTYANLTWSASSPLAVFPGTTYSYTNVTLYKGNVPSGTVTINMPSTMAGKNFMLLITKNLPVDADTWHYGGGQIFSTLP